MIVVFLRIQLLSSATVFPISLVLYLKDLNLSLATIAVLKLVASYLE